MTYLYIPRYVTADIQHYKGLWTSLGVQWLLLLLLSHFSRGWLWATSQTAGHQAPPSLGFSRQEHWSGLPFPSPMHKSEKWKGSQSCLTLRDPMDGSLPGSSVHGIFQARVLEWGAIAFWRSSLNTNKKNIRLVGWYGEYTWDRNITETTENLL